MNVIKIIALIFLLPLIYIVWWHLPVSVNRHSDIKFGNTLIGKIEQYKKQHGLPESNDWVTLKELGFKDKGDYFVPNYEKLNDTAFQLVYVEGFDGPYLFWNSYAKQWKKDFISRFPTNDTEDEVVSIVQNTPLYIHQAKVIDSLSSGKRHLNMIVTLQDTTKHIYLVKVSEDNGNSLVTYFNFLVDANTKTILNPTGKLEGL